MVCPIGVLGDVLLSVAVKIAINIILPGHIAKRDASFIFPIKQTKKLSKNKKERVMTGILLLIALLIQR